jgi:hypothetical protein
MKIFIEITKNQLGEKNGLSGNYDRKRTIVNSPIHPLPADALQDVHRLFHQPVRNPAMNSAR